MTITYTMNDSGETYQVKDNIEFVEVVKNSNAHTRMLTIPAYIERQLKLMDNVAATDTEQATSEAADALVNAWIERGIISKEK